MIALIDCNAFYCSAEILFKPWLADKAVVVASNNDGAIVSRTDAAKKLGIKMGQPMFEIQNLIESGQVTVFSSNYSLYQSLSNRIMAVIAEHAPRAVIYSIDECFVDLSGVAELEAWGRVVQKQVMKRLGMPVGVGIGRTMTLAKMASYAAKKWKHKTGCVVVLDDVVKERKLLAYAPVSEVWGVGRRTAEKLKTMSIHSALDLALADPKWLRGQMNVNIERTARELNGMCSYAFGCESPEKKQMIASTRSFGSKVYDLYQLENAVSRFVAVAAEKLRRQQSLAQCMQVFARSSLFRTERPFSRSVMVKLAHPTQDTRVLTQAALEALRGFYVEGVAYAKAGIVLSHLVDAQGMTDDLFDDKPKNSDALMKVMDAINLRQGRGTLRLARDVDAGSWKMSRKHLSPEFTTQWGDLPRAR